MMVSVDSMMYSRVTLRASLSPRPCGIALNRLNDCGNSHRRSWAVRSGGRELGTSLQALISLFSDCRCHVISYFEAPGGLIFPEVMDCTLNCELEYFGYTFYLSNHYRY